MVNVNQSYQAPKMGFFSSLKKRPFLYLKNGWYVLRYSVLFRITYEIENLLLIAANLSHFVPSGTWTRLLKIILRSKFICESLKRIETRCWKKMTFDTNYLLRKKTDNNSVRFRHPKRALKHVTKDDLKRANELQYFMNHYNHFSQKFTNLCQTILSEKSK